MKIGISYWFGYPSFPKERIELLKEAGFDSVSLHWTNEYMDITGEKRDVFAQLSKNNIEVSSFHLSFERSYLLWDTSENGRRYREGIKKAINDANEFGVKRIVMHSDGIASNNTMLNKLFEICLYADHKGVILCLENLQHEDNLNMIYSNTSYKRIPLCYDVGHNNIRKCLIKEKNLDIQYFHIHDNDGIDDLHCLPFEGTVDWHREIEFIRLYPDIPRILEVHEKLDSKAEARRYLKRAKELADKMLSEL